ncbi:unnamed protein product, partial [Mesorhabditis spiculigera]
MYPTVFVLYLVYGIPTFILYLRAIYVICKRRQKFSSSFYTLFTNLLMVFWRYAMWPCILLVHAYSLVAAFPFFLMTNSFIFENETVMRAENVTRDYAFAFATLSYSSKIYIAIGFVLNVLSLGRLWQRHLKLHTKPRSDEISLFVIGLCSFVVQLICGLVVDAVVSNVIRPDPKYGNVVTGLNGDCMAFTELYIGIACNGALRRAILGPLVIQWKPGGATNGELTVSSGTQQRNTVATRHSDPSR